MWWKELGRLSKRVPVSGLIGPFKPATLDIVQVMESLYDL